MQVLNPYDTGKWALKITNFMPYKDLPDLFNQEHYEQGKNIGVQ